MESRSRSSNGEGGREPASGQMNRQQRLPPIWLAWGCLVEHICQQGPWDGADGANRGLLAVAPDVDQDVGCRVDGQGWRGAVADWRRRRGGRGAGRGAGADRRWGGRARAASRGRRACRTGWCPGVVGRSRAIGGAAIPPGLTGRGRRRQQPDSWGGSIGRQVGKAVHTRNGCLATTGGGSHHRREGCL